MIVFEVGTARLVVLNRVPGFQEATDEVERALKKASRNIAVGEIELGSQTKREQLLAEILFYIHERAKCEDTVDRYLEHVLEYCKKDYIQAWEKRMGMKTSIEKVEKEYELMSEDDAKKRKAAWFKRED